MEEAKIVLFEDEDIISKFLEIKIEHEHHYLVEQARNKATAEQLAALIETGQLMADVLIADNGFLRPDQYEALGRYVVTIGFSGGADGVEGAKHNIMKPDFNSLFDTIGRLERSPNT